MHPDNDTTINPSGNASIREVMAEYKGRRNFLKGSLGMAAVATLGGFASQAQAYSGGSPTPGGGGITFTGLPPNLAATFVDAITVPAGYTAKVLVSWGDAIGRPVDPFTHWDPSTAMTEARQLTTFGAHNDGMHFFPFPTAGVGGVSSDRGLLCVNHEYNDPGLVTNSTSYGTLPITQDIVNAQLAAHGVSVVEVQKVSGAFQVRKPSALARRITGKTPMMLTGPAAGHPLLRTAADATGTLVMGTLNNCAHGFTPWGTYLTCEENFNGYFGTTAAKLTAAPLTAVERRYGLAAGGFGYRWHEGDPRFDFRDNPNEPNRFGWVVEIDPWNPNATPAKRTALGRFKHEGAWTSVGADNKVAVYLGDDERNDYQYKFVCAGTFNPKNRGANRNLLDSGTLYVAKFNADGTGQWLPLVWGQGGLTPANGFADQAEVLIKARQAADRLGATMMDRPEWVAVHPTTREVYLTLTNNNRRGTNPCGRCTPAGGRGQPAQRQPLRPHHPLDRNRWRRGCHHLRLGHLRRVRRQAGRGAQPEGQHRR
jgi:secreted PhoX family phosphatase